MSVWFHKNFSGFLKLKLGEVSSEIAAAKNSQFGLKFVGFHCVAWKLISTDNFNIVASQKSPFIKNTIVAPKFDVVRFSSIKFDDRRIRCLLRFFILFFPIQAINWKSLKILRKPQNFAKFPPYFCLYVDKSKVEISQNFVAFSEYMNFKWL